MFNLGLMLVEFAILFGLLPLVRKFFGKVGITSYMTVMLIVANIQVLQVVNFGPEWSTVALGSVAFAVNFLATDILSHTYGPKVARKAVTQAVISFAIFFAAMQITLAYLPDNTAWVTEGLKTVFGTDGIYIWISVSSLLCYFLANILDTYIFSYTKKFTEKLPGHSGLWVRSSISGVANLIENFLFAFLGMWLLPRILGGLDLVPLSTVFSSSIFGTFVELFITITGPLFLIVGISKWATPVDND